jgi:hypothetical protein
MIPEYFSIKTLMRFKIIYFLHRFVEGEPPYHCPSGPHLRHHHCFFLVDCCAVVAAVHKKFSIFRDPVVD